MPVSDYASDLELISKAAAESGRIAMEYFKSDFDVWDKAPNHPVTDADLAVNDYLKQHLLDARPDYGWLSEETRDTPDRLSRKRVFIIDPIDGTRAFLRGEPDFCIAIAVLEDDRPVASALFAPAHDEMFEAVLGEGARKNGAAISVSDCAAIEACRTIAEPSVFTRKGWPQPWPQMAFPARKPNATAYRMALVADGRWDNVMVFGQKADWDLAAATLIVEEAGGKVSCHDGAPFQFNQKHAAQRSLIAGGPVLHGLLIDRCKDIRLP